MSAPQPLPTGPPQHRPGPVPVQEPPPLPPSRRPRWGLFALAAGLAGGLAWWMAASQSQLGGGGPTAIRTAAAERIQLRNTLRVGGAVAASRFVAIRAPQISRGRRTAGSGGGGGSLTLIEMAAPGSTVRSGDVVAVFDRQSQEELIERQQSQVAQAGRLVDLRRANLSIEMETRIQQAKTAKAEFEKAELDLRTAEVRSAIEAEILKASRDEAEATYKEIQQEVEQLRMAHAAAVRQVEIDKAQELVDLSRAERNADRLIIKTPLEGIVVMQTIFRGGSFSQSSAGDEIHPGTYFMQIVDSSEMVLEASVNQADVQKLRVGQRAEIRLDAYPEKVFDGRVASVAAIAGSEGSGGRGRSRGGSGDFVRNVTVKIAIEDRDPVIIPDLSASADILLSQVEDAIVAPREALTREGEQFFVWLKQSAGDFIRREVQIGQTTDTDVAIQSGLAEGDLIALERLPVRK